MTTLADDVLPLIRTRAELWRWREANEHGAQMHRGIDILETAAPSHDPAEVYAVTHKALASAVTVIARADDSSGIIGDACQRLLEMHPGAAQRAHVPYRTLVDWLMKFQFGGTVDYFNPDPVAYAPALGEKGLALFRERLAGRANGHPDEFALQWNERRFAVLDRDAEAIIRTHLRDGRVAAWYQDTAEAFEEIGEHEAAIDGARQGAHFDGGHQSVRAGEYWCRLLETHRPAEVLDARLVMARRWPNASTAARLFAASGSEWPRYRDEVLASLAASPHDAVVFTQSTLKDVPEAWRLAHSLGLTDARTWSELIKAYEKIDPLATLAKHRELVEQELEIADAQRYRLAARRLARMSSLATGTPAAPEVDEFIAQLRETHRRRPRLQLEFDRAGLPRA